MCINPKGALKMLKKVLVRSAAIIMMVGTLVSCASGPVLEMDRGYSVGETVTANVGEEFLSATYGSYRVVTAGEQFGAAMLATYGQKIPRAGEKVYSDNFLIKDLVYSGRRGDVITVDYREYRTVNKMAAPAFFQTVEYDLSESKDIYFRNFGFRVVEATNRSIKAVLISDQ